MDALISTLLSTAHHLSEHLGLVPSLFDRLLDRLAPQTTAAACKWTPVLAKTSSVQTRWLL